MALTKCNHQVANLPCLDSDTGIDNLLTSDESRGICHHCHLFQKSIRNTGSKKLPELSGNAGKGGFPFMGSLEQ